MCALHAGMQGELTSETMICLKLWRELSRIPCGLMTKSLHGGARPSDFSGAVWMWSEHTILTCSLGCGFAYRMRDVLRRNGLHNVHISEKHVQSPLKGHDDLQDQRPLTEVKMDVKEVAVMTANQAGNKMNIRSCAVHS